MSEVDINEILDVLPQAHPFLLVDRVLEKNFVENEGNLTGSTIKAIKNVTYNEPFFPGHFPKNPIMPGVLLIEAMAQTAALLCVRPHPEGRQWQFYICGVDNCRFKKTVRPGDQVVFNCKVTKDRRKIFVFSCEARVDGDLVAKTDILAQMS